MAFQSDLGERDGWPHRRMLANLGDELRGSFQAGKSGFLCRERRYETGVPGFRRNYLCKEHGGVLLATGSISERHPE